MKILFLIDTLEIGGAEKSLLEILPRFKNFSPVICHLYPGDTLKEEYEKKGVEVVSLNLPGKYSYFQAVLKVQELVCKYRPVLIHATLMRSSIVSRLLFFSNSIPVINGLVNDTYTSVRETNMSTFRRVKHRAMYVLDLLTCKRVNQYIANSEAIKNALSDKLNIAPNLITTIYRGRKTAAYSHSIDKPFQNSRDIICVARLYEHKGHKTLLAALPIVLEKHNDVRLYIVGDGPNSKDLQKLIQDLSISKNVFLMGQRDDIPELLASADVFVSCSEFEGLPGAVVEAMLSGLPLVLSDINVHREMIEHGRDGLLVPLGNSSLLAESLIELMEDPARAVELGLNAQKSACEKFDIEKIVVQYENLYAKIIHDKSVKSISVNE